MLGLTSGSIFQDRYEIISHLGSGGMGMVYKACDRNYKDFIVAIKILNPGIIKTAEIKKRFRNEIIASYRLNHKNVIKVYDYFDHGELQAYSMEYVDGSDLSNLIQKGITAPEKVVDILQQLSEGLQVIHQNGIVHRDLKPDNILLAKDGTIKITDFGVARLLGGATLTAVGSVVGTPKYLSPEYIETGSCDHRGDIFALGIIGYELLTGEYPYHGESVQSLMINKLKMQPKELVSINSAIPKELREVVEQAMAVKIIDRFQTAEELRVALENAKIAMQNDIETVATETIDILKTLLTDKTPDSLIISEAKEHDDKAANHSFSNLIRSASYQGKILLKSTLKKNHSLSDDLIIREVEPTPSHWLTSLVGAILLGAFFIQTVDIALTYLLKDSIPAWLHKYAGLVFLVYFPPALLSLSVACFPLLITAAFTKQVIKALQVWGKMTLFMTLASLTLFFYYIAIVIISNKVHGLQPSFITGFNIERAVQKVFRIVALIPEQFNYHSYDSTPLKLKIDIDVVLRERIPLIAISITYVFFLYKILSGLIHSVSNRGDARFTLGLPIVIFLPVFEFLVLSYCGIPLGPNIHIGLGLFPIDLPLLPFILSALNWFLLFLVLIF